MEEEEELSYSKWHGEEVCGGGGVGWSEGWNLVAIEIGVRQPCHHLCDQQSIHTKLTHLKLCKHTTLCVHVHGMSQ